MGRTGILTADNKIASDVWIDREDAPEMIKAKLHSGDVTDEEASILSKLWEDGYVVFPSGLSDEFFESAVSGANNLWQERHQDLLCADPDLNNGRPMPQSMFPVDHTVRPGCRMLDAHSHLPQFLDLTTLPRLHRIVDLLLGREALRRKACISNTGARRLLTAIPGSWSPLRSRRSMRLGSRWRISPRIAGR